MTGNFLIGGVIISPLVPELLLAVLLTGLLSWVLMRLNFYRLVWHRPLVELALFCIMLGVIVALTPDGSPLLPLDPDPGPDVDGNAVAGNVR